MERLRPARLPLLAAGMLALAWGIAAGLVRMGWAVPVPHPDHLVVHGPLMICGFLGTVIALERAVAHARPWAFLAPALTASGVAALMAAPASTAAPLLMTLGSVLRRRVYLHISGEKAGRMNREDSPITGAQWSARKESLA